jgi:hypothetical protein
VSFLFFLVKVIDTFFTNHVISHFQELAEEKEMKKDQKNEKQEKAFRKEYPNNCNKLIFDISRFHLKVHKHEFFLLRVWILDFFMLSYA